MAETQQPQPEVQSPQQPEKKNSLTHWIIAGVIILMLASSGIAVGMGAFGLLHLAEPAPFFPSGSNGSTLTSGCEVDERYLPIFNQALLSVSSIKTVKISSALIAAIFYAGEHGSSWPDPHGPWATSSAGAQGPFQFMPGTWAAYGMKGNVQNINDGARGAVNYLNANYIKAFGTEEHKIRDAIYAYNHSEEYVDKVYSQYLKFAECNQASPQSTNGDKPADFFLQSKRQDKVWNKLINDSGKPTVTGKNNVSGIVLHYTAGGNVDGAISAMTQSGSLVHLIIDKNGDVYQLMPLDDKFTSGSGDGNKFAIGIEIVGMNEDDLYKNDKQFNEVIKTIKYLRSQYPIANERGDGMHLDAMRGIFGHYQVQGRARAGYNINNPDQLRWSGLIKGCQGVKIDPGKKYMKKVWDTLKSEGKGC